MKCKLCGDRDETINHIISECSKLTQNEYKTRHDWVGKVIFRELCKKLNFNHKNKWFMHNSESVLENETHKVLWDFEIQTDHLRSARRPDIVIVNNKKKRACQSVNFAVPADHRVKLKENEKKDQYLDLARELKKIVEHESDGDTNCNWCSWDNHEKIDTETWGLGNKRTSRDHPNHGIVEIGQNIVKSPGDLRRLAVTQTPVRNHRFTLVWKTLKEYNNNNNNNNNICTPKLTIYIVFDGR